MAWLLHTASLMVAVTLHAWVVPSRAPRGVAWALPGIVAALSIPFAVPVEAVYVRAFSVCVSVAMAVRTYELARGLGPDRRTRERFSWFAVWLALPPEARAPKTPMEVALNREQGRRRLLRALAKAVAAGALVRVHQLHPELHDHLWVETLWAMWLIYVVVSGVADVTSGLVMQAGAWVDDIFDAPALARSPRDFWARRWNLVVHRWALRNVFLPLGGRRRPLLVTAVVFVISGLMHEWVVFACLGRPGSHTGWMLAFFSLQGLAVVAQTLVRRWLRRPLASPAVCVLLHFSWMLATAPIFVRPLGEIFGG